MDKIRLESTSDYYHFFFGVYFSAVRTAICDFESYASIFGSNSFQVVLLSLFSRWWTSSAHYYGDLDVYAHRDHVALRQFAFAVDHLLFADQSLYRGAYKTYMCSKLFLGAHQSLINYQTIQFPDLKQALISTHTMR